MQQIVGRIFVAVTASMFAASPAWAGCLPAGVPAPVIGLGLPALVGMGLLYRRLRKQSDNQL